MVNHGLGVTWRGVLTPCCQWYPDHDPLRLTYQWNNYQGYNDVVRRAILDDFDQGVRHTGCAKCFMEEDHGYESLRQRANRLHPQTHDQPSTDNPIYNFELRLSNHCNLRCIMCGPYASTSWHQEYTKHKEKFDSLKVVVGHEPPDDWSETPEFRDFLTRLLPNAKVIDFSGGEPFTLPSTQWVLQTLSDLGLHNVVIQCNSNYTKVPPALIKVLKNFTNLFLSVSLEGVGAMNDYLRYPADWADIEANIDLLMAEVPAQYNVNHTFQHASAYSLPALIDFCLGKNIDLRLTMATGRPCLTMDSCPPADLARLAEIVSNDSRLNQEPVFSVWGQEVKNLVTSVAANTVFNPQLYQEYRSYVGLLDEIRGTNYDQVFVPSQP